MTFREQLREGAAYLAPVALGVVAAIAFGAGSARAQMTPSPQEFLNAASDTANWILPAKSYSGNHFTNATQISPDNVSGLQLAWKFHVDDAGPMEVSPIIYNGTMYVTSAHDHVYALDAATGKMKWDFKDSPHVISFAGNRGIALLDGNVYLGTLDGHLIALNAENGQKLWDKVTVDDTANAFYTMAPVPYHDPHTSQDMLLLGVSNGDWGGNGNLSAYDPKDGHVLWRWETVPGPGQPGHETWSGDSWKRGGASTWGGVTIDTDTQTMYLDLGNPGPDFLGSVREGDNLYSDSMVALDMSAGQPKMKWYHQFIAHDTHDWDPPMQPLLFSGTVNNATRKLVAAGDKACNFWILDAGTGKLVDHTAASFQMNQDTAPSIEGNIACPNTLGGIEYQGAAFDPATNAIYVPSQNECGFWTASKDVVYIAGQFYLGGGFPKLVGPNTGQMDSIDVSTGVFNWRHHFNLPNYGGALVTASGLLFSGNLGGAENAFDIKTGRILWFYDTGAYIQAPTGSYEVNGKQYVVVASGGAGNAAIPELPDAGQQSVVSAFTLK